MASRMGGAISFNQIEKALRGSKERRTLADGHNLRASTPSPDPAPTPSPDP